LVGRACLLEGGGGGGGVRATFNTVLKNVIYLLICHALYSLDTPRRTRICVTLFKTYENFLKS